MAPLIYTSSPYFPPFSLIIPDIMKSEERQKLAKERREEKAKYIGKWKQGVGGQAYYIGRELPLVLG